MSIESKSECCILSVVGSHGGGSVESIITRKYADIAKVGRTFWAYCSRSCQPSNMQTVVQTHNLSEIWCHFLLASTSGSARPTMKDECALSYSVDKTNWLDFPIGMGPVTGNINGVCYAMVFDKLEIINNTLDIWLFSEWSKPGKPIKFSLGNSTICASVSTSILTVGMKSRFRSVVARGRLVYPFFVYLSSRKPN